ncbi:DUF1614 domain-containing protein [Stetteria hydrogenophila]
MFLFYFTLLLPLILASHGALAGALSALGLGPEAAVAVSQLVLLFSLALSPVNVVVRELGSGVYRVEYRAGYVSFYGIPIPVVSRVVVEDWVLLAVNLGGAAVPAAASAFMLALAAESEPGSLAGILAATAATALVVYAAAKPVPGVGVVVPMLLPPLAAAVFSLLFIGPSPALLPGAYVAGTLGSLLGADVLRLARDPAGLARRLGAKLVSIGGAGVFDGVYLSGLAAVLLGYLLYPPT